MKKVTILELVLIQRAGNCYEYQIYSNIWKCQLYSLPEFEVTIDYISFVVFWSK